MASSSRWEGFFSHSPTPPLDLRQGSRSVAELVIDFRIYAAESGWRDDALRDVFQRSLADHLRDEIVLRDEPSDLEALITLAM